MGETYFEQYKDSEEKETNQQITERYKKLLIFLEQYDKIQYDTGKEIFNLLKKGKDEDVLENNNSEYDRSKSDSTSENQGGLGDILTSGGGPEDPGFPSSDELYNEALDIIQELVGKIDDKGSKEIVGRDRHEKGLKNLIESLYAEYFGIVCYPKVEDKAVALFYFIIKNHIFWEGNKRIASLLLIHVLERGGKLKRNIPEKLLIELAINTANKASTYDEDEHKTDMELIQKAIKPYII